MKKTISTVLLTLSVLSAGSVFTAYGQEQNINHVSLSFSWDATPAGGQLVGEIHADSPNDQFVIEGSEYLKKDDTWIFGEQPIAEVELSAKEGYRFVSSSKGVFSLTGCGAKYRYAEVGSDGNTLILHVSLPKVDGTLPPTESTDWSGKTAVWDAVGGVTRYEIQLFKDSHILTTVTTKDTSYDFADYINVEGNYSFRVRAKGLYDYQASTWSSDSGNITITREDAWLDDNGTWKKEDAGWRFVYANGAYPVSTWRCIKDKWYYFNEDGYMVSKCYVRSASSNLYYWIGEDGIWDETWNTENPNRAQYRVYDR